MKNSSTTCCQSIVDDLADLFVRHRTHLEFGICLLPKNCTMKPNIVLVPTKEVEGLHLCQVEEPGFRHITLRLLFPLAGRTSSFPIPSSSDQCEWGCCYNMITPRRRDDDWLLPVFLPARIPASLFQSAFPRRQLVCTFQPAAWFLEPS